MGGALYLCAGAFGENATLLWGCLPEAAGTYEPTYRLRGE